MSDTNDFVSQYQRHLESATTANAANKATVFGALTAADITRVAVTFNGEGDSGQIEDVTAYRNDASCDLPSDPISMLDISWGVSEPKTIPMSPYDAIETLCYDYLSQEYGGWENNDGAFGEFTLHVADRRIQLDFSARYTDFITHNYTF
jgi:hypothetical protein